MKQDTFLLIDGFNLLSRGYFATSYGKNEEDLPKNSNGLYTNGIRVFFQKLFNLIKKHDATHVGIAWDVKREETERRKKYDFYKATRKELPTPLIEQFEVLKDAIEKIGISQIELAPYEADDIIGTLSAKWSYEANGKCLIYSNDKDLLQLLNGKTSQIIASKGEEFVYTIDSFRDEYGIDSKQWVDVKALLGDPSDNIPGCPGVGVKSALPLVKTYNSVEEIYKNIDDLDKIYNRYKNKLVQSKESVMISKELATICCTIPEYDDINFEDLKLSIQQDKVYDVIDDLELKINFALIP